jgi:hypothetical protein
MPLRPRAVITTPYPSSAATARALGITPKRYREIRAAVTEFLERHGRARVQSIAKRVTPRKSNGKRSTTPARRREAGQS